MRLNHPTIPGKTVDVPQARVGEWLDQGWVRPAPVRKPRKPRKRA